MVYKRYVYSYPARRRRPHASAPEPPCRAWTSKARERYRFQRLRLTCILARRAKSCCGRTLLRRLLLPVAFGAPAEQLLQVLPGVAFLRRRDVLRRAFRHHAPAAVAAVRAHVDHPVGRLDDFQVVLDDDHGIAGVGQLVQHLEQLRHVVEMQSRGRLVEDVQRAPRRPPRQLLRQLDALRLAA